MTVIMNAPPAKANALYAVLSSWADLPENKRIDVCGEIELERGPLAEH